MDKRGEGSGQRCSGRTWDAHSLTSHQAVLYNSERLQTCLWQELIPSERQAMDVELSLWQLSKEIAAAPCVNHDGFLCCMTNASLLLHFGSCRLLAGI